MADLVSLGHVVIKTIVASNHGRGFLRLPEPKGDVLVNGRHDVENTFDGMATSSFRHLPPLGSPFDGSRSLGHFLSLFAGVGLVEFGCEAVLTLGSGVRKLVGCSSGFLQQEQW